MGVATYNYDKMLKFKKELGIPMNSKETSSRFNNYVAFMHQPVLATVSLNTCSQMHVHSLAYLQDIFEKNWFHAQL